MDERYTRNLPSLSEAEQAALSQKRVLLAGCGGLGGYLLEYLARLGVGAITVADADRFEASNLNRQLLSSPALLGSGKAAAAKARVEAINPGVTVTVCEEFLTADNASALLAGCDLALDALDNSASRLVLEDACAAAGLPLVHGAVFGWSFQVAAVAPGSGFLHRLYAGAGEVTAPGGKTTLSFVPAACAAVQAAQAACLLAGRSASLAGRLLIADLETAEQEIILL